MQMKNNKPNVLWIFTDQHRGQAMSCAGDPNINTSHLDRLAAEGVYFPLAYSNTPICVPARGTVYTGQYITRHGAIANHFPLLPDKGPQMAEVMQRAGYDTCHHGKWHLSGGTINQHFVSPYFRPGWNEWIGWECMHGSMGEGTYFRTNYCEGVGKDIKINTTDKYQPDWLTDRSIQWLKSKERREKPWFHVISIETPHGPCNRANVPDEYYDQFKDIRLKMPLNFSGEGGRTIDEKIRCYYAMVKNIDDNVGGLLQTLDETGQLERTIIFYFSDHGDFLGSHGRGGKSRPEEEASRIPFIVRLPASWMKREGEQDSFISLVDLMPTTLGLCGIPIPRNCQGDDLSSYIRRETERGKEEVYLQYEGSYFADRPASKIWRALRYQSWVYVETKADGPYQLFDLQKDPHEINNLIQSNDHEEIRIRLAEKLKRRGQGLDDPFFM
jgi:arylsulfatase A-like enzyme